MPLYSQIFMPFLDTSKKPYLISSSIRKSAKNWAWTDPLRSKHKMFEWVNSIERC